MRKIKYTINAMKTAFGCFKTIMGYFTSEEDVSFFVSTAGFVGKDSKNVLEDYEEELHDFQTTFQNSYEKL